MRNPLRPARLWRPWLGTPPRPELPQSRVWPVLVALPLLAAAQPVQPWIGRPHPPQPAAAPERVVPGVLVVTGRALGRIQQPWLGRPRAEAAAAATRVPPAALLAQRLLPRSSWPQPSIGAPRRLQPIPRAAPAVRVVTGRGPIRIRQPWVGRCARTAPVVSATVRPIRAVVRLQATARGTLALQRTAAADMDST